MARTVRCRYSYRLLRSTVGGPEALPIALVLHGQMGDREVVAVIAAPPQEREVRNLDAFQRTALVATRGALMEEVQRLVILERRDPAGLFDGLRKSFRGSIAFDATASSGDTMIATEPEAATSELTGLCMQLLRMARTGSGRTDPRQEQPLSEFPTFMMYPVPAHDACPA